MNIYLVYYRFIWIPHILLSYKYWTYKESPKVINDGPSRQIGGRNTLFWKDPNPNVALHKGSLLLDPVNRFDTDHQRQRQTDKIAIIW